MKKVLASILVLTMLLFTLTVSVLAAPSSTGDAGIEFEKDDPGIVDPDPDVTPNIKDADIHFGKRKIAAQNKTYSSLDSGVGIPAGQEYAGLVVANPDPTINWKVTAEIGDFIDSSSAPTLLGFELELDDALVEGQYDAAPTIPATIATLKSTVSGGSAVDVLSPQANFTYGTFGVNYSGELLVLLNTASAGTATAVMTWTFNVVP